MYIELDDMDVMYGLTLDCNDEGKDFIRIMPRTDLGERDEDFDICLTKSQAKELARVLNFMAKEIK